MLERTRFPALVLLALSLLLLGPARRIQAEAVSRRIVGVVSGVDVVGSGIEVRTNESVKKPHRISFLVERETTFRGGAASISDLRVGEEVTVTYFPARVPHTAERVEVMR